MRRERDLRLRQRSGISDRAIDLGMTEAMKVALKVLMRSGPAASAKLTWKCPDGTQIDAKTIYALYDRYLVTITIDGRTKPIIPTVQLTDVGALAAQALAQIEKETPLAPDDIDGCTEVYGDWQKSEAAP